MDPAAHGLGDAVRTLLDGLDATQRATATFRFDDPERFVWTYLPGDRAGLALAAMSEEQRTAAGAVLDAALSARTRREVASIIALEPILKAIEQARGRKDAPIRDSDRYAFAVFGDPTTDGPWAWRVGGHHLAVQQSVLRGRVIASAPSFLGANPATVPSGPMAGARGIDGEETLGRGFLLSLSPVQQAIAIVDPVAPPDILSGTGRRASLAGIPEGIRYDQLEPSQQADFESLIRHYLGRVRAEVAADEWERVADAGLSSLTFAWAGPMEPGRGHYYAIRGARTLIEYDNTQDGANHIHSVWRDLENDWGEDVLARHYRDGHPAG